MTLIETCKRLLCTSYGLSGILDKNRGGYMKISPEILLQHEDIKLKVYPYVNKDSVIVRVYILSMNGFSDNHFIANPYDAHTAYKLAVESRRHGRRFILAPKII